MTSLTATALKEKARALGFDRVGIARAGEADGFPRLDAWLAQGYAGEMSYLHRHAEARRHPSSILPEVKSVVMVAVNYSSSLTKGGVGRIARYARSGKDYHDVLWEMLGQLFAWVQELAPGSLGRAVVDTAPLLERDFAQRAGLGWVGKNTMLIDREIGSYFFLGALLLDVELEVDAPFATQHCGTCTACLQACPTQAFPAPGILDARRCISYLTIELKGSIPEELRPGMGDWLFGCDVCQEVCPWNRDIPESSINEFRHVENAVDAAALLTMTDEEFCVKFKKTALWRARRRGVLRNASIVLGNTRDPRHLPVLQSALQDAEPLVREAAAWAIETIKQRTNLDSPATPC